MKSNKNKKKKAIIKGSLVAGVAITALSSSNVSATEALNFSELGTGSDVREALSGTNAELELNSKTVDMKCGEGKCGKKDAKKGKDAKDHKCGEGKCGKKGKDAKDHKCGEGKCGKKGKDAKDHKCGEGKCGKKDAEKK